MTERDVKNILEGSDYYVKTYSPGDGITRYRFFRKHEGKETNQYFGPENGIATFLGASQAYAFSLGVISCQ